MENQTKFCKKCGAEYTVGKKFCAVCGEPTEESANVSSSNESISGEKPKKKSVGLIIGVIAVVLVLIGVLAAVLGNGNSDTKNNGNDIVTGVGSDSEEVEFEIGTVNGSTYENKYLGIKCDLAGWTYDDREQLAENTDFASEYVTDNIDDETFIDNYKNASIFMDMRATHPNGTTNVNIMVQKMPKEDYGTFDEKTIMNAVKTQIVDYYADIGMNVETCEVKERNVNGTVKYPICTKCEVYGTEMYMMQFYNIKEEHTAVLTITGQNEAECLDICNSIWID